MRSHCNAAALMSGFVFAACNAFSETYRLEVVIPGHGFNGIHGLTFDSKDQLYVGSVIGQKVYKVDTQTGDSQTFIAPPQGMADDLEFGPDGTLVWTSITTGIVHAKKGDEPVREIATGLPGVNALAFNKDGRLFVSLVFLGDALYEMDPTGATPPKKLLENIGGLNGFDFGPDGFIYGPLWFKGTIVKINADTGEMTTVAEGFQTPAAVNFNSKGELYALDTKAGMIYRVDTATGIKTEILKLSTAMDNLAFDSQDRMFVTVMVNNSIYEVNTTTGVSRAVKTGRLSIPCDISVVTDGGKDTVYVSDVFGLRTVDPSARQVDDIARNYVDPLENPIGGYANDEKVLAISWFTNAIQQFNRKTSESELTAHEFAVPSDAVVLPNGDWAVLELGSGSLIRAAGPDKSVRTTIAAGLPGGVCLTESNDGAVYVTRMEGVIDKVNLETGEVTRVASGLSNPEGIDLAPDGSIIVAEVGKQRVVRVDPATGSVTEIRGRLTIGLPAPAGNPPSFTPTGIAVSKSGVIYVASDIEDALFKLTPN